MYRCENCGQLAAPREKLNRVTLEARTKEYENTRMVFDQKTRRMVEETFTTVGTEIIREAGFCNYCFNNRSKDAN